MTGQTNLDLRARFAQLVDTEAAQEAATPERPAHPLETAEGVFTGQGPAPERRPRFSSRRPKVDRSEYSGYGWQASPKQRDMIVKMHRERFAPEVAEMMLAEIDWTKVNTRAKFDRIFQALKDVPRIDRPARTEVETAPKPEAATSERLFEGVFTVEFEDGSYRTLRVRRQADDAKFMPGKLLVGFLSGSDNESDYTNFGHVLPTGFVKIWKKHEGNTSLIEAVKVLRGDQVACAKAYARLSQRCSFCSRPLTTPESLDAGYGRDCAEKRGLPWG